MIFAPRRWSSIAAAATCCALIAACSVPRVPGITPYKPEIQQGNYLSQEMVAQLKPGMTREQVRFLLGTPLLADIFHADRWDYVYWVERADGRRETRKVALFFAEGKLSRMEGDVVSAATGR